MHREEKILKCTIFFKNIIIIKFVNNTYIYAITPLLDGVFTVIKALFHDSQNLWSSEQILQAWGKTRSVKSNKNSDCHREKGNQNVKLENWTKGKQNISS